MRRRDEITYEWELETAEYSALPTRSQESRIHAEANAAIVNALARSTRSPITVEARMEDATVIITGQVEWNFQRELARRAVETVAGVEHVDDRTTLRARAHIENLADRVRTAMTLDHRIDASHVIVTITGDAAVLTGYVRSVAEKKRASLAARVSPDVTRVENRLAVRRSHFAPFRRHR